MTSRHAPPDNFEAALMRTLERDRRFAAAPPQIRPVLKFLDALVYALEDSATARNDLKLERVEEWAARARKLLADLDAQIAG